MGSVLQQKGTWETITEMYGKFALFTLIMGNVIISKNSKYKHVSVCWMLLYIIYIIILATQTTLGITEQSKDVIFSVHLK